MPLYARRLFSIHRWAGCILVVIPQLCIFIHACMQCGQLVGHLGEGWKQATGERRTLLRLAADGQTGYVRMYVEDKGFRISRCATTICQR